MKTRERTNPTAEEPRWYESAARPSTPGVMTKAEPADLAQASDEEDAENVGANRRKMRWVVGGVVAAATLAVAVGNVFDSIYYAALALFYAVLAQPRERVPKLLRYFSIAAVLALTVLMFARLIMKQWGG